MSFTGDLAHMPIVDVVQLIHTTRKSGTLTIQSQKGQSQLVFSDGYFVSANHLDNSVRIGQLLTEMGLLSEEGLEKALLEQKFAGEARRPLVATLIEQGVIKADDAYKGLEALIEMTIVEVLTWSTGTFSLDVDKSEISDEYRYFPETLQQEILINAQGILLDALRIYDEKMRDGTLENIFFSDGETAGTTGAAAGDGNMVVTADLLGLDALDTIQKEIPAVFSGLKDDENTLEHRRVIAERLGDLPQKGQEELCSFLSRLSANSAPSDKATTGKLPLAVIMFSRDHFITHAITTVCRSRNLIVFTTDDESNLDLIIEQSFSRDLLPILIVDDPAFIGSEYTEATLTSLLQQKRDKFPRISILQMCSSPEDQTFPPHALDEGTDAIFPRPVLGESADSFVSHMTGFLTSFCAVLDKSFTQPDRQATRWLKESVATLATLTEPPEVARQVLMHASLLFERAMVLVVGASELTAEKGIGVIAEKSVGLIGPLMYKIPRGRGSVFDEVIEKKRLFYGLSADPVLKDHLHTEITPPHRSKILVLPLVLSGNVIALIYADFGRKPPAPVQLDHLEILSRFAGLVLDYSFYRKKFERLTQPR